MDELVDFLTLSEKELDETAMKLVKWAHDTAVEAAQPMKDILPSEGALLPIFQLLDQDGDSRLSETDIMRALHKMYPPLRLSARELRFLASNFLQGEKRRAWKRHTPTVTSGNNRQKETPAKLNAGEDSDGGESGSDEDTATPRPLIDFNDFRLWMNGIDDVHIRQEERVRSAVIVLRDWALDVNSRVGKAALLRPSSSKGGGVRKEGAADEQSWKCFKLAKTAMHGTFNANMLKEGRSLNGMECRHAFHFAVPFFWSVVCGVVCVYVCVSWQLLSQCPCLLFSGCLSQLCSFVVVRYTVYRIPYTVYLEQLVSLFLPVMCSYRQPQKKTRPHLDDGGGEYFEDTKRASGLVRV